MKIDDGKNNGGRVPLHKKAASQPKETDPAMMDEDKIMESIDNLDMLLANMKDLQNGQGKQQALNKLVDKYNIKVPVNQAPPQQQP